MNKINPSESDPFILASVKTALLDLEAADMLVCVSDLEMVSERLTRTILKDAPQLTIDSSELSGLGSLAQLAIKDDKFFDWEMPTLTGFTADDFKKIIAKLPKI